MKFKTSEEFFPLFLLHLNAVILLDCIKIVKYGQAVNQMLAGEEVESFALCRFVCLTIAVSIYK